MKDFTGKDPHPRLLMLHAMDEDDNDNGPCKIVLMGPAGVGLTALARAMVGRAPTPQCETAAASRTPNLMRDLVQLDPGEVPRLLQVAEIPAGPAAITFARPFLASCNVLCLVYDGSSRTGAADLVPLAMRVIREELPLRPSTIPLSAVVLVASKADAVPGAGLGAGLASPMGLVGGCRAPLPAQLSSVRAAARAYSGLLCLHVAVSAHGDPARMRAFVEAVVGEADSASARHIISCTGDDEAMASAVLFSQPGRQAGAWAHHHTRRPTGARARNNVSSGTGGKPGAVRWIMGRLAAARAKAFGCLKAAKGCRKTDWT